MKYEIISADNSSERRITPYFPFLTFSFGGCRTVLSFRKDKTGVEVGIKDQGGIETLALLVLNPFRTPVFPFVSSSLISSSVSILLAFSLNMGRPHSVLSHRTTLPKNCILPVPHLGHVQPESFSRTAFRTTAVRR